MDLETAKDIATIAGVSVATVSLLIAAYNTRVQARTNRARFWLDLRGSFAKHDEVHLKLRPGGEWAPPPNASPDALGDSGPEGAREWFPVESYMGLFEHCEIMLSQGLIDEATFREIYAYRVANILRNRPIVREKLIERAGSWRRFLALVERLGLTVPRAA